MAMPAMRAPAVAGLFYPGTADALQQQIQRCFLDAPGPGRLPLAAPEGPRQILGLVVPHAGLVYSGHVAAHAYQHLAEDGLVEVAIILAPNHHGLGADNAVWPEGGWETPLGNMPVAADVAAAILEATPLAHADPMAHLRDHAIEVQLPFLQLLYGAGLSIVPISMKRYELDAAIELGEAIATAMAGRNAVVIASCDFTHHEPASRARTQDERALEMIEHLDPAGLFRQVQTHGITTCGYGPVAAMLAAARLMGAVSAQRLAYHTSGEVTGDYDRVVAYAALKVMRPASGQES